VLVEADAGAVAPTRSRSPFAAAHAGRVALGAVVLAYVGLVLLAPVLALCTEVVGVGVGASFRALAAAGALAALGTSFVLLAIALPVNAVVGTILALAIVRHRFPGRAFVSALADLPLAVSPVMIGLAFLLLFGRGGLLHPALEALSLEVAFSFPGLLLATLFVTLPYVVREVAYVLEEVGTSEEDAAATLGASPWQSFVRVTLPNARVGLGYGLLMTAARSLGEFGAVLVLGGSISGRTQTATTFVHDAVEARDLASAYGMSLVLAGTSVALLLALRVAERRRARQFEMVAV
jgi:sulfate transport system permease protein